VRAAVGSQCLTTAASCLLLLLLPAEALLKLPVIFAPYSLFAACACAACVRLAWTACGHAVDALLLLQLLWPHDRRSSRKKPHKVEPPPAHRRRHRRERREVLEEGEELCGAAETPVERGGDKRLALASCVGAARGAPSGLLRPRRASGRRAPKT
jgi:hypothetical protein